MHVSKKKGSVSPVSPQSQIIRHDYFVDDCPVILKVPQMQKPFDYGWHREIVYRNVGSGRNADVLYVTPCGKRLGCHSEIERYLQTERITYLSVDWFSFNSHHLVGGGDKEVSKIAASPMQEPWRKSKWSTVVICTRHCPGRKNARPSLQCMTCKSFYHPECVFLSVEDSKKLKTYMCTHCMLEENPDALKLRIKRTDVCPILKLSFDCLLHIFSYLSVIGLCSTSRVCMTWNHISSQPCLWHRVSLHDVEVKSWSAACRWMVHFSTQRLDLRGIVHGKDLDGSWAEVTKVLRQLTQLKWLDFGLVPAQVVQEAAEILPDLEVLSAEWISESMDELEMMRTHTKLDIGKLSQLTCLKRLHLRAACAGLQPPAFTFSGGLPSLAGLTQLTKLSLTTLKGVPGDEFTFLTSLNQLEELEIGDCLDWNTDTYKHLACLTNLHSLRLECGSTNPALSDTLLCLHRLVHLELIMFGIPEDLGDVLQTLSCLRTLAVWPEQTNESSSHCLTAMCHLTKLHCVDFGVVVNQPSDLQMVDPTSKETFPGNMPIMPVSSMLCGDVLEDLDSMKDTNDNISLSLDQAYSIIRKALPGCRDVRVYCVPLLSVQQLYFTV